MTALQTLRFVLRTLSRTLFPNQRPTAHRPRATVPSKPLKNGDPVLFVGRWYRLRLVVTKGRARLVEGEEELMLYLTTGTGPEEQQRLLWQWYRRKFKALIPELLARWEPVVGVHAQAWGVKLMKTRWGTCNPRDKRIWLNLELAKKNLEVVEYVLVHELVHLLEPSHNARFKALMTQFYPRWKEVQRGLKGLD